MRRRREYTVGAIIVLIVAFQIGREVADCGLFRMGVVVSLIGLILLISAMLGGVARIFLAVALLLTAAEMALDPEWPQVIWSALLTSGFFVAFFSALTALKNAAGSSPSMAEAGTYLARQPPSRRYLALTVGAQAFAILLNYGAIQLLGSLAMSSTRAEADEHIRRIRTRRMLQAIHRGFVSSLSWSPLSFSIAISTAMIPGTNWASLAAPGAVASAIIVGSGWALDTIFKPKPIGGARRPVEPYGTKAALIPLGLLLTLMLILLLSLSATLPIRVVGLVLIIIPVLSLLWMILQLGGLRGFGMRFGTYLTNELPSYNKEIMLIATAGYIGATGSSLVEPYLNTSSLDLTTVPSWLLLIALILVMPILGQIGANPILSMSLIAPLLPPAEDLGVTPSALALSLICGWTMAGITSPFTATNLLIGRFGDIRPIEVGWVWNRSYFFVTTALLALWTMCYAFLLT